MKVLLKNFTVLILFTAFLFTSCAGDENSGNDYTYIVTFDSQDADIDANPESITVVSPATTIDALPAVPSKLGYVFTGWWTDVNGGGEEFTISTKVTNDITVYVCWSTHPAYTVTYDSEGGTPVGEQHVIFPSNTVVTLPVDPIMTGYIFAGWMLDTDCSGTEFTADTIVTEDITIYACWDTYTYTVTFNSGSADTEADPVTKTVSSPATTVDTLPTAPIKAGCDFAGWSTEINGGGTEFTAGSVVSADVMVYAMWSTTGLAFSLINDDTEYSVAAGTATAGNIIIPGYWSGKKVTAIGTNAFSDCSGITSMAIPDSISSLGSGAFNGCSGLTYLMLPDSLSSIGNAAFKNCSGLTSLVIPDNVASIGNSTFSGCGGLMSLTIPYGVISIGASAFGSCSSLTSLIIPESVNFIGYGAFSNCSGLTSLTLPTGTTIIEASAFIGCSSLTTLVLPYGTIIGEYMFMNCTLLTNLTLPEEAVNGEGLCDIGEAAFSGCSSLTSVSIPSGTQKICVGAFAGCSNLESVSIPFGVQYILTSAFQDCTSLSSLTIPWTVFNIGSNAFRGCTDLTSLTIPANVSIINTNTFYGCTSLKNLSMSRMTAPSLGTTPFSGVTSCTLHLYSGATGYNVNPWTNTSIFSSIVTDL